MILGSRVADIERLSEIDLGWVRLLTARLHGGALSHHALNIKVPSVDRICGEVRDLSVHGKIRVLNRM